MQYINFNWFKFLKLKQCKMFFFCSICFIILVELDFTLTILSHKLLWLYYHICAFFSSRKFEIIYRGLFILLLDSTGLDQRDNHTIRKVTQSTPYNCWDTSRFAYYLLVPGNIKTKCWEDPRCQRKEHIKCKLIKAEFIKK